jgi:hypothetical protein
MRRNCFSVRDPLPSTTLSRTWLMPLTPAILLHHLPGTVRIPTLMLTTKHTSQPVRSIPLTPTIRPSTLMIRTKLARLTRKARITPRVPALVILAELAPIPLLRTRTKMTPMIATVRR